MYTLQWRTPSFDVNKGTAIDVPVGTIVSNKSSLRFTGKGAANYGTIQQENLMRLLENFAGPTAPDYPTVGETWYDTANSILRLCSSTSPLTWKSLAGVQITNVGEPSPASPALGDIWVQRTGSSSVVMYIFTGLGRYPWTATTIGGWEQVWPTVTAIAGREEFAAFMTLLNQLIGPASVGGNGANGKAITNVPDLALLDTAMRTKFAARTPLDPFVLVPTTEVTDELLIEPNSNDWDLALAAAKYAINRLELPPSYADDISPVPFVSDGRQAPASLLTLPTSDARYPSLERRSNRKFGIVTLSRLYTETMNVMQTAVSNRYSLKGINGSTGTNTAFASNIQSVLHAQFQGALGGLTSANMTLRFTFPTSDARDSFLNSGGVIQVTAALSAPTTPGDTAMKALLDSRGYVRLTADKARIFANQLPLTMSLAPIATGLKAATSGGVTMMTTTLNGATYTIGASIPTATTLHVAVTVTSSGAMNGTLNVRFDVIKDIEQYQAPALTYVYGAPNVYTTGDKTAGTAALVYLP